MIVSDQDRLTSAAHRAETDVSLVAHALVEYRHLNGLDVTALATWLGCGPESLPSLALCPRPFTAATTFKTDVERLARVAGCDPVRLEALLGAADPAHAS